MKLLYQTHSPYARKVLVAAHEVGLAGKLKVIHHETSPTRPNDEVVALNPLGKVPVLIHEGQAIFDSSVICEFLDGMHQGAKLIPQSAPERWLALRLQALSQGIADSGISVRWEVERRPEEVRWPAMRDAQLLKISSACDFIEREVELEGSPTIGEIALATTLSWIEFRDVYDFAKGRPRLAAWYGGFSKRPSMLATTLSGATHD